MPSIRSSYRFTADTVASKQLLYGIEASAPKPDVLGKVLSTDDDSRLVPKRKAHGLCPGSRGFFCGGRAIRLPKPPLGMGVLVWKQSVVGSQAELPGTTAGVTNDRRQFTTGLNKGFWRPHAIRPCQSQPRRKKAGVVRQERLDADCFLSGKVAVNDRIRYRGSTHDCGNRHIGYVASRRTRDATRWRPRGHRRICQCGCFPSAPGAHRYAAGTGVETT